MYSGEIWGYRARLTDELTAVEVLRIGDKRPARVLVRFLDESMEDRREWVPPSRLKVLWSDRSKFEEDERRWARIHALASESGLAVDYAADQVVRTVVGKDVAEYEMLASMARVHDVERLATQARVDTDVITGHPDAFPQADGDWIIPWPAVEPLVRKLAALNANQILQTVEEEERAFEREATHGYTYRSTLTGEPTFMESEYVASTEMDEHHRPLWNVLREWCGEDTVNLRDELNALRVEIRRVGGIAEQAIGVLRLHGFARQAESLSNDLGLPVAKPARR